jgi:radical SAM protein with 4Fe4S-binding SPASM domain
VAGLSFGSIAEQSGYVWVAFHIRLLCKVQISPIGLRFAGECLLQILVGLGSSKRTCFGACNCHDIFLQWGHSRVVQAHRLGQERPDIGTMGRFSSINQKSAVLRVAAGVAGSSSTLQCAEGCQDGRRISAGSIRKQSLTDLYRHSSLFTSLRNYRNLKGKCGDCEFREICGGSRARAFALTSDVFAEEPCCVYQPRRRKSPESEVAADTPFVPSDGPQSCSLQVIDDSK